MWPMFSMNSSIFTVGGLVCFYLSFTENNYRGGFTAGDRDGFTVGDTHWGGFEGKPIDLIAGCQVLWSVALYKGASH